MEFNSVQRVFTDRKAWNYCVEKIENKLEKQSEGINAMYVCIDCD